MIAIVDYDAGNIKSVEKALQFLGQEPVVTRDCSRSRCFWRCDGKDASIRTR